jgi:hypothetical protein
LFRESAAVFRALEYPLSLSDALNGLGTADCGGGELDQAREHLYEALQISAQIGDFVTLLLALPSVAVLLAGQGDVERAVEIYALASRYPVVANSQWFEDVVGKRIAAGAASMPPEAVAAAQERGRARDLEATVQELLEELGG